MTERSDIPVAGVVAAMLLCLAIAAGSCLLGSTLLAIWRAYLIYGR